MPIKKAAALAVVSAAVFLADAPGPLQGLGVARAETPATVRVRIDFRTLYCKNTTGDEPGSDEVYVKTMKLVPGSPPGFSEIPKKKVDAGKYAWDGDNRKVLWEGNLAPGQSAAFIVNVMEDDGSPPNWKDWAESGGTCAAASAAVATGAGALALNQCATLGYNIVRALNGDDIVGQFTVTVKNENGTVKKSLSTSGPRSQIGGYSEPALSDSGKTIRMRLGQGKDHPQRYQASLQIRQITDIIKDEGGTALSWSVTGRDDAK